MCKCNFALLCNEKYAACMSPLPYECHPILYDIGFSDGIAV